MYKLLILLSISFAINASAKNISQVLIDHANNAPREIQKSHLKLSSYLIEPCENETEKVLIFSYWIAKRIKYDLKEMKENDRNKIAREVLANRKAVCGGYSNLFKQFCDNEKIKCYKVSGYAWGNFFKKHFSTTHCAHAWNVVYTDKKWQCIDVTWSSNSVKASRFKKDRELDWVFADPSEFAKTHYPLDPRWQLINTPLTQKEFWKKKSSAGRKYNALDSLNILLEKDWIENRVTSIKGEFVEQQDVTEYLKNLARLGWKLAGGSYNQEEINRAKIVFHLAQKEYNKYAPFPLHKTINNNIKTGLWLCKRRTEMKE